MMLLKFAKENKKWYIDLPKWTGKKSALRMVSGADTLLDYIANGDSFVYLYASFEEFKSSDSIILINKCWFNGANYENKKHGLKIWLCDVTKFVMGRFPDKIFFAKAINFQNIETN